MNITANKPVVLGGAAALGLLVIGGYFYVSSVGVEKFEDYLYDNRLQDALRYRDASYSPLSDTITLKDVDLELVVFDSGKQAKASAGFDPLAMLGAAMAQPVQKKLTGNLETLSLKGVSKKDRIEVRFSGFHVITDPTPRDMEHNVLYEFAAAPMAILRTLGIEETRLGGRLSYQYDQDDDTLRLGIGLDADAIAGTELDLELGRARRLVEARIPELVFGAIADLGGLVEEFGRVEFISLQAKVEDHGFVQNMSYLDALARFDYAKALNGGHEVDALRLAEQLSRETLQAEGMKAILDEKGIKALHQFQVKGGGLELSTDVKRPVPFSQLIRDEKLHRDIEVKLRG
jgi:hypothetical protein